MTADKSMANVETDALMDLPLQDTSSDGDDIHEGSTDHEDAAVREEAPLAEGSSDSGSPSSIWESLGVTSDDEGTPDPDVESLDQLLALADDSSPGEVVERIAKLMTSEEEFGGCASAFRLAPREVESRLMKLGTKRGLAGHSRKLLAGIKREAKAQKKRLREAQRNAAQEASDHELLLEDTLDYPGLPPGLICPSGWLVSERGIKETVIDERTGKPETVTITRRPIIIEEILTDQATGGLSLTLSYPWRHGWKSIVMDRGKVLDRRGVVGAASQGAPISSDNSGDIVRYLQDYEEVNLRRLPEARGVRSMGWVDDDCDELLWGSRSITRNTSLDDLRLPVGERGMRSGVRLIGADGTVERVVGFHMHGTWEGWLEAIVGVSRLPIPLLLLYASLIPPLMPLVPDIPIFIVEPSGKTSRGKTKSLHLAASAWGHPDHKVGDVTLTWKSTVVGWEQAAILRGTLPLLLDDTKHVDNKDLLGTAVYDFTSGRGKTRGRKGGGMEVTGRWRTILLSSGEAPITSFSTHEGARARVLALPGHPFGEGSEGKSRVEMVTKAFMSNYGLAGPRLTLALLDKSGIRTELRDRYASAVAKWSGKAALDPVASRMSKYIAALDLAEQMAREVLGLPKPECSPLDVAWRAVMAAAHDSDQAAAALIELYNWAASDEEKFYGRRICPLGGDSMRTPPYSGWRGAWVDDEEWTEIAFVPGELRDFLKRKGYGVESFLQQAASRGWLSIHKEAGREKKIIVGREPIRCYVFLRSAIDDVSGGCTRM